MTIIRRLLLLAIVALAGSALPSDVEGQEVARDGFFIGFGFGYGSLGVEGGDSREGALSGYLKLGGALSDQVLLGAESNAWTKDEGGGRLTYGHLSAVAYVYPTPGGPLYLKGGIGLANVRVDSDFGSGDESGLGLTLGIGYDIGFGGRFALTPFGNFLYGSIEETGFNLFQLGLGVNWY